MKTKVLMFGWEFPPHNSGGLGTACLGLTKALSNLDVHVTFVLPRRVDVSSNSVDIKFADTYNFEDLSDHIEIKQFQSLLMPYLTPESYEALLAGELSKYGVDTIYGRNLYEEVIRYGIMGGKIAKETEFDVIHAHDWLSFKAGIAAKKVSGKPLVVHVHATEYDRTGGSGVNPFIFDIEKQGMEYADEIIAVSNLTKNIIINYYGIPAEKIQVIHNGINHTEYPHIEPAQNPIFKIKEAGNKIVLFVGRITVQKGPDYFVSIAKRVIEYYPKVLFVVAGAGDMEYQIIKMAADMGVSDKVLFAGFLRGEELNKLYKAADLFVMPSISEPFGLTALESVANGTPVLISKQTGVSETLTHALKADFWDIDEMTNKILAVLNYDALHLTLRENGNQEVTKQNWDNAAQKCILVYKKFLDKVFSKNPDIEI